MSDAAHAPSLRRVFCSGEALPADLQDRFFTKLGAELHNLYGPTEAAVDVSFQAGRPGTPGLTVPIGRPIANLRLHLLDSELRPVPAGAPGEVFIAGTGLARGYLHRPALTAERFVPDPFRSGERLYRTGDLARNLPDGAIEFLGRLDFQVKIRGFRIELGEIEAALRARPEILDAVVVAREDARGKSLAAYVVPRGGEKDDKDSKDGKDDGRLVAGLREALAERLPEYMVPGIFVVLPALPLTPSGKVDRKALPAPERTVRLEGAAPTTAAEEILARVWAEVLGLERVGVHDNFFALGGDSILSIQVVSRAARQGCRVTPRQIFEHPTVSALALVASLAGSAVAAQQGPVTGAVRLTPIQRWFFESRQINPAYSNQAVLLVPAAGVSPVTVEHAVAALVEHHDALRLRFAEQDGAWHAWNEASGASPLPWHRIDLSAIGRLDEAAVTALERATAGLQASLDLTRGPILRAAWLDLPGGAGSRLLLAIHHLAVDGVSWRILVEDLETACRQIQAGEPVTLPAKTTSFQEWAERLSEHARGPVLEAELAWWTAEADVAGIAGSAPEIPVDFPDGDNSEASARQVSVWLEADETRALLQEVPAVYRTQINDALLTALARAFGGSVLVDLEGHGREEIFPGVDLSRTVGWFTTLFPVRVDAGSGDPAAALRTVKEHLRALPGRGLGYGLLRYLRDDLHGLAGVAGMPRPQVSFNYLGQLDQGLAVTAAGAGEALFLRAPEPTGPSRGADERRREALSVSGAVTGGRLRMDWTYSANLHRAEAVEALAGRFLAALRELIATSRAAAESRTAAYTPSDFPLAHLRQQEIDSVLGTEWAIEDVYPLSAVQEGLLFHTLYEPGSGVYVEQLLSTFHGSLDDRALEAACRLLVARHPILRTSFHWRELDRPVQVVHGQVEASFVREDWRDLPEAEHALRLDRLLQEDRAAGFDLSRAPVMRWRLIRTAESEHRLLWSHHHILLDGWSFNAVADELLAAYRALATGSEPALPRRRPYRDYLAWLDRRDPEPMEAYWRRALAGWSEPTPVPVGPAPAGTAAGTAEEGLRLPVAVHAALQAEARRRQVTLNTLVQAAWGLLLGRYSGRREVVFGVTVAGRPADLPGVESMVGLFINTLPVRLAVGGEAGRSPLGPWLQDLQLRQSELRQFEHSPLARVQALSDVPAGTPLFESILVFENYPRETAMQQEAPASGPAPSPLGVADVRAIEQTNYPLTVLAIPGEDLALRIAYDRARFEAVAVRRMLEHLRTLLGGLAQAGEQRLDDLALLSEAERHQLLLAWNDTAEAFQAEPLLGPLHRMIERQVRRAPEATAVVFEGEALSYADLDRRANQLAHALLRRGVRRDSLVGVCAERSVEMVVALLAVLKAGAGYVPVEPDLPAERLGFLLEDSGVPVLLTQRHLTDRPPAAGAEVLHLEGLFAGESDEAPDVEVDLDSAAYAIYTSGSTGRPKGAVNSHRAIANRILWMQRQYGLDASDRVLQKTPFGFDVSVWEFFWPLLTGARLVVARPEGHKDPEYLAGLIAREGITTLHFVPSMLRAFLEQDVLDCPSVRRVFCSGEALPADLQDRFFAKLGAPLHNLYGPTEAAVDVSFHACAPGLGTATVPIGRPIANLRLHLLDPEMRPVPVGVPGEVFIAGVGLARGYLHRPALTAERFVPDPAGAGERMYRTGDLARHLQDGAIEFLGRLDFQVKIRGFRIELGEIEAALRAQAEVLDAVVVARDEGRGKSLVAYVVPRGGEKDGKDSKDGKDDRLLVEGLREALGEQLPEYMVPGVFVVLPALPLTPSGKVDRKALPAPERVVRLEGAAPTTAAEEILARVWAEVLGLERVGVHDNFFELGGDSILSIQVVSRAARQGCRVTPRQIFEHPTVSALALVANLAESAVQAFQGPVTGEVQLTPIQRWFLDDQPADPHHFNQAVLLAPAAGVSPETVERAVAVLVEHHDALRLRFLERDGAWTASSEAPAASPLPWHRLDLSGFERLDAGSVAALERATADLQASLDLGDLRRGPILRAAWLDLPGGSRRFLLAIHHLAVDGVSWRILLEDLETACRQIQSGEPVALPPKTTSFQEWAARLAEHARSEALEAERGWWLAESHIADSAPEIPVDFPNGDNTEASGRQVSVWLEADETRALLQEVPAVYRTQINDALLTALARAFGGSVLVDLEGHGREEIFPGADLSRTVGWFTTLFPVRVDAGAADPGAALRAVKEHLRAIPQRGLGYGLLRYLREDANDLGSLAELPRPEVMFNYLGQLDQGLAAGAAEALFLRAPEPAGPLRSPRAARPHALVVNAAAVGGRLRMDWAFSANLHREETVAELAGRFAAALRELVAHCRAAAASRTAAYTPSDFPLARLRQDEIDAVLGSEWGIEDAYPLSPMQEGILFHSLFAPGSGVYVEQLITRLWGDLDDRALEAACRLLVERHAILRTSFHLQGLPRPVQVVHGEVETPFLREDWRGLPDPEIGPRLDERMRADRAAGFDLSKAPVARWCLIRTAEREHQLLWTFHHVLLDGWSFSALSGELLAAYQAFAQGAEPELPRRRPFRDYLAWLGRQDPATQEEYWRRTLAGWSEPTPLPLAREANAETAETASYEARDLWIGPAAMAALQARARGWQVTLNTLVQAAWGLLLGRYAGRGEVVFGVTVSGRPADLPDVESMIGLFINTLPLRLAVGGDADRQPVASWLRDLQLGQSELRQHEHSPLVAVQGWSDVPRGTPLFESILIFENFPRENSLRRADADSGGASGAPALGVVDSRAEEQTHYPLTTVVLPGTDDLLLRLAYDRTRYDAPAVERLLGHFRNLLEGLATEGERRLGDLAMLALAERAQILAAGVGPAMKGGTGFLHGLVEAAARRAPGSPALLFEGRTVTFGDLDRRADAIARALRRLGTGPESRVAVACERSPDAIAALLGILKAGGAYVPLDPESPRDRLAAITADAGAQILLTQERFAAALAGLAEHEIVLDWFQGEESSTPLPAAELSPENAAYVIYTSGSTGTAKGVVVPHRSVVSFVRALTATLGLGPADRLFLFAPLSFDASVLQIFLPLANGGALALHRNPRELASHEILALCRDTGLTILDLPAALWRQWVEDVAAQRLGLPETLRGFLTGGESVSRERLRTWAGLTDRRVSFLSSYGPTETTVTATAFQTWNDEVIANGEADSEIVPIGRPLPGVRAYVLDRRMEPAPVGAAGDLVLAGAGLTRGYLGRPDLTADAFRPDPFVAELGGRLYRTGDLARLRPDGDLDFLGRADTQVKLRGFRLELGEVEATLLRHPGVREAAAIVREDRPGDRRLVAYVVAHDGEAQDAEGLRDFAGTQLPAYMVPSAVVLLEAIPVLASGKVDRAALPAPPEAEIAATGELAGTPVEEVLAAIWAEVLGREPAGAQDDFFALGGHSLTATQVVSRARDAFGVDLSLRTLFENPTLGALAARIEEGIQEEGPGQAPPVVPVPRDGETVDLPQSFAQQRLYFLDRLQPGNPFYNTPIALRFRGALDLPALAASLGAIVARHEVLRTTFHTVAGEPVQRVHGAADPAFTVALPLADLTALAAVDLDRAEAEAQRLANADFRRPFDLERGPLVRLLAVRLGEQDHLVVFTVHHIVSDGWSIGVLVREIMAFYRASTAGEFAELPALPVQYADYAHWQRNWLQGEVMDRLTAYWTGHLAGAPPLLELPEARPRPETQSFRGAQSFRFIDAPLARELHAAARRESVSLFMLLLAAFQALLAARTGRTDVVVGTDVAGRNRSETEGLIGFFINQLALRTDLAGDPTVRQLLGRVRDVALGAYAHQEMPFDRLVDALRLPRNLQASPVFQAKLVLQNVPEPGLALPDLSLTQAPLEMSTAQLDLNLRVSGNTHGLGLSLEYSTDLYDAATIDRLLEQLETVLRFAAERPETRLSELTAALAAEERKRQAERDQAVEEAGRQKLRLVRRQAAPGRPGSGTPEGGR